MRLKVWCEEGVEGGSEVGDVRKYECWIEVVRNRMIGYDGNG